MYFVTFGHWPIDTANGRTWLVYRENATTYIAAWMSIIIFYAKGVTEIVTHGHWLSRETTADEGFHKAVRFAEFTYEEETFALLRYTTIACIKDFFGKSIACLLEDCFCIYQLLGLGDASYVFQRDHFTKSARF